MSLETDLFKLINNCEYSAALTLLEHNPGININTLDEDGCSLFMAAVENYLDATQERYPFVERVLSHPDFQHANKPLDGTTSTPFNRCMSEDNPIMIATILKYKDSKNIQVVFDKDKLNYELQAEEIKLTMLETDSPYASPLLEQQKILASLLQVTVHHAIETDDPTILQRLADAGAKLHHALEDGTYPINLVQDQPALKVHQWLSNYIKEQMISSPTLFLAGCNLALEHKEREQAIIERHWENTRTTILSFFKFYDPDAQPSSSQSNQEPKKGL